MKRLTKEEFIRRAEAVHGKGRYDYSSVDYKGRKVPVTIKCLQCERTFEQLPEAHWRGARCPWCSRKRVTEQRRKPLAQFIREVEHVYGKGRFDFSKVNYVNISTPVEIKCLQCGHTFKVTPFTFLKGKGCPTLSEEG